MDNSKQYSKELLEALDGLHADLLDYKDETKGLRKSESTRHLDEVENRIKEFDKKNAKQQEQQGTGLIYNWRFSLEKVGVLDEEEATDYLRKRLIQQDVTYIVHIVQNLKYGAGNSKKYYYLTKFDTLEHLDTDRLYYAIDIMVEEVEDNLEELEQQQQEQQRKEEQKEQQEQMAESN